MCPEFPFAFHQSLPFCDPMTSRTVFEPFKDDGNTDFSARLRVRL